MGSTSGRVPAHLPERLAISLWDFSWYTRAGAGEPFADLDSVFGEAVARGYNAVRICAAPLYLFGPTPMPEALEVSGLGIAPTGDLYGAGTRWYDVSGGFAVRLLDRLLELFAAADRHDCVVILSSWEYQQSPAFAQDDTWWRALDAIPFETRLDALAAAWIQLIAALRRAGLTHRIAFVELHNEVDFSRVPDDPVSIDRAVGAFSGDVPDVPVTVSYGKPPHLDMSALPSTLQLAQMHVYSYGVLDALQARIDLRDTGTTGFPNRALRALLRREAPSWAAYGRPAAWRLQATVITDQMLYGYDNVDPRLWDRWLYDHYGAHRQLMHREIESRVDAVAAWARRLDIPVVIGEGWVGYTPLLAGFEEGPIGTELAEHGMAIAARVGAWGATPCSNAAPHHPMWIDIAWQQQATSMIVG